MLFLLSVSYGLYSEDILKLINTERANSGLSILLVSNNLVKAAETHNNYLIKNSMISHEGVNSSQVSDRAVKNGATALKYGEIIGYSPSEKELFKNWILSPTHKSIIYDPKWNWIGIFVEKVGDLFVVVADFSTGNIASTSFTKKNDVIHINGIYIDEPIFKGNYELINYINNLGVFDLYIKGSRKEFFIYAYNKKGELTDRVDIFLD